MNAPTVSVVMATYNHARYVAEAIDSVLQQCGVDFELLIADDGSDDCTTQVVESIVDSRIRFFAHPLNRGACIVINELISQASGEFIALINSDDRWLGTDKLAFQLDIMASNPTLGACFGRARFIDKHGAVIRKNQLSFGAVFDQMNRTQGAWLRHFFEHGNCICHPTMLIRRRCFEELGGYSNNLRQLPDLDMWIRLVKGFPIYIAERELVEFRVLPGESASSQTVMNSVRIMNEHYLIAESFFDNVSSQHLTEGFVGKLARPDIPSKIHEDIEKALLLLLPHASLGRAYNLIGLIKINRLLMSDLHRKILAEEFGIDGRWMHKLTTKIDVLRPWRMAVMLQIKFKLLYLGRSFFELFCLK